MSRDPAALRAVLDALFKFEGLPHRVQKVAEVRAWLSTTTPKHQRRRYRGRPHGMTSKIVLIAGGDGKGQDFSPCATPVATKAKGGRDRRDGDKIAAAIEASGVRDRSRRQHARRSTSRFFAAQSGDTVHVSPACASFDMFRNYEHRAESLSKKCLRWRPISERLLGIGAVARPTPIAEFDYAVVSAAGLLFRAWTNHGLLLFGRDSGGRTLHRQSTHLLPHPARRVPVRRSDAGFICFQFPLRVWEQAAPYLFCLGELLLILVLIPGIGREVNGSRRWLSLGLFNLQPPS